MGRRGRHPLRVSTPGSQGQWTGTAGTVHLWVWQGRGGGGGGGRGGGGGGGGGGGNGMPLAIESAGTKQCNEFQYIPGTRRPYNTKTQAQNFVQQAQIMQLTC